MREDYLWDRSGVPDPAIERLERTLESLRYRPRVPAEAPRAPRWRWALAAAAVAAVAFWLAGMSTAPSRSTAWQVAKIEGNARLGAASAQLQMSVRSGELVRTAAGSQITLEAEPVGRIDLGPDSQLRAATDRSVVLESGRLHAFIWAPPRVFSVDTPSARAVDLGCEYTLNIDSSGDGLLRVSMGWVAFQFNGRESFIPAGAECRTRRRTGPGIPYYDDAPEALRKAVAGLEDGQRGELADVLSQARPRDGLTLWHLLTRVAPDDRGRVFDRLAELVDLPSGVTREAALRGDSATIDLCWNALHLEDTGWWRGWERVWK